MSELSNAVTVLIARMESHPEDFNTTGFGKPKFRDVADALYGLAGLDKERAGSYWFLTDADKEALIEAWKKYHRAEMERAVMNTIFDDGSEERERQSAYNASMRKSMSQQAIAQQQIATQNARQGQITPLHNNPNQGLFGGAVGSALGRIF
jgi:hypothetical protein